MRTAIINLYENGRLRVLDCESLVQSHHLSWLKRLYGGEGKREINLDVFIVKLLEKLLLIQYE